VWLFGAGLVVAGLLLLLNFITLLFWQFGTSKSEALGATLRFVDHSLLRPAIVDPVLTLLPKLPPAWLTSLHIAMVVALLGVALGSLGILISRWQTARISVELRRVRQYRDADRLEPFIGPGTVADMDEVRRRRVVSGYSRTAEGRDSGAPRARDRSG
jgi:ABC-type Fe3+ transport system permease subunit